MCWNIEITFEVWHMWHKIKCLLRHNWNQSIYLFPTLLYGNSAKQTLILTLAITPQKDRKFF